MPFPFSAVCDLLEQSYRLCQSRKSSNNAAAVHAWFRRHRAAIDAHDADMAALLSTLLPEKRTDRVYCIQAPTLERVIGRALMLGSSRMLELATYKRPGAGVDLAECVERILSVTSGYQPNPVQEGRDQIVTVEQVDELLLGLAARIRWSAPAIRESNAAMSHESRGDLESMYRRLSARDAKWFTRLVLKDYQPLIFDANLLYRACDPVLPCILQIRDDFTEALAAMSSARGGPLLPMAAGRGKLSTKRALATVKPKLGVKVGRQQWLKGRSIKHCIDMGSGRMSVETKLDGEYCQIHVDLSRSKRMVQIFSKSGKDSTEDRFKVIPAIERALRLRTSECGFQEACILEGELVVYNDLDNTIMPFHKIRGHVTRRGRYMNTEQDSQPKPYEHLMIVYYDIFLVDDQSLMDVRHSERLKILEKVVDCERGLAALVQRETIDFGHSLAASALRKAFAKIVVDRGEGLVLKPDEPYIVIDEKGRSTSCRCIKLKKEYIGAFGDVGDFALVGAGFHAAKAKMYRIPNLKWTHFYIGCLNNKEQVKRWGDKPEFTIVCALELPESLLQSFLALGELTAVARAENTSTKLIVPPGIQCPASMTVAFANPAVVDLRCFSFDKPGNTGFWTPRFPAITKMHADRDYTEVLTFDELQAMAREAVEKPAHEDSQENLHWIAKLEGADPRGVAVDAVSQATATTMPTPSPVKTTQSTATADSQESKAASETSHHSHQAAALQTPRVKEAEARREVSVSVISISSSSATSKIRPQKSVMMHGAAKRVMGTAPPPEQSSNKRHCAASLGDKSAAPSVLSRRRRPLENMDANVSYVDSQSIDSQDGQEVTMKLEPPRRPADAQQDVIEIPSSDAEEEDDDDDDDDDSLSQDPSNQTPSQAVAAAAAAALKTIAAAQQPSESHHRAQCRYVGTKCGFVGKTVLLSSSALLHLAELTSLLRSHGVDVPRIIPCVETWWRKLSRRQQQQQQQQQSRVLLVDSVQQGAETKALVARLDAARKEARRVEGDWISVYDWRVLKHVSIAEDAGVEKKYYDGFQDPWRRWYCGLV
ncbi:ATP dependent DNA ligase domain protein [Beauveria brongniartii RCEF 3172]|uniref:ATP dependent DNA ligase domain protein n=1 Tax=Beauveria brongniartii RCEF 3172 TaxID=1081107 RepID=A0A162HUD7_9HYPO|nr:ATP dependent DNA ligase domain protein [Beauveria brongniartii RCEF 3172]